MTRLSIRDLFAMKPGDKYRVYWAKDDDPQYVRLNYDTQTVLSNDGETLTDGDYDWYLSEAHDDLDNNVLDTSRGLAYFYRAR